jgi:hypothetical protein
MARLGNLISAALAALCLVAILAGPAAAKDAVLTEDSVTRFLASFAEMRTLAIKEGLKVGLDSETAKDPLNAVLKAISGSKLKEEAEKSAKAHGFASTSEWGDTGKAVLDSYIFITVGAPSGTNKAQMDKGKADALKIMEQYGFMNAGNKKQITQMADSVTDQLSHRPPEGNVAIVKKMKANIDAAVKIGTN